MKTKYFYNAFNILYDLVKESLGIFQKEELYRQLFQAIYVMSGDADDIFEYIITTSEQMSSDYLPDVADFLFNYARCLHDQDEDEKAKAQYLKCINIWSEMSEDGNRKLALLYLDDVPEDDSANDAGDSSVDKPGDADNEEPENGGGNNDADLPPEREEAPSEYENDGNTATIGYGELKTLGAESRYEEIKMLNGMKDNVLSVGFVLLIP